MSLRHLSKLNVKRDLHKARLRSSGGPKKVLTSTLNTRSHCTPWAILTLELVTNKHHTRSCNSKNQLHEQRLIKFQKIILGPVRPMYKTKIVTKMSNSRSGSGPNLVKWGRSPLSGQGSHHHHHRPLKKKARVPWQSRSRYLAPRPRASSP